MMPIPWSSRVSLALVVLGWAASARADVRPGVLFTEGAVLQRGMPVPVWGTADDGEKVTVKIQDQEASTTAKDGKWMVRLPELKAGGPFVLTIEGKNKVEVADVLVGEVWICSGQSNMEWTLGRAAEAEAAKAARDDPSSGSTPSPRRSPTSPCRRSSGTSRRASGPGSRPTPTPPRSSRPSATSSAATSARRSGSRSA